MAGFVLALLVVAIVLFATEWIPIEAVALALMVLLAVTGVLSPAQALSALASPTVLMIAGIMLLTGAIVHNGAADFLAGRIRVLAGKSERRMAWLLLGAVNALSSVINNVAATAVFIPVAEGVASRFRTSRALYLMPVAFASMTGGMCTLIGTSTNVAVSGAMEREGLAPLGLFELAPVGVTAAVIGVVYLVFVTPRILGRRAAAQPAGGTLEGREFLYEIWVTGRSRLAGQTLLQADLGRRFGLTVLAVVRGEDRFDAPDAEQRVLDGDLLLVKGGMAGIEGVRAAAGLEVKSMPTARRRELEAAGYRLAEITVSYNSPLIGRSLKDLEFRRSQGVSVLAIHRNEEDIAEKVGKIPLRAGDVLLAYGREGDFVRLAGEPSILVVEMLVGPRYAPTKAVLSLGILGAAVLAASTGLAAVPIAFVGGAALALTLGLLPVKDVGAYLNLRFLVMLAGMITLGMAMETSGASRSIAEATLRVAGAGGPVVVMGALFVLTVALTQPLSNAAAAVLVVPVAVEAARQLGLDPRGFAITVCIAASCSFITPFEPACMLVYGTGHYRFADFVKLGFGLTLLVGVLTLLLVPRLWPLAG